MKIADDSLIQGTHQWSSASGEAVLCAIGGLQLALGNVALKAPGQRLIHLMRDPEMKTPHPESRFLSGVFKYVRYMFDTEPGIVG